ncbi:DUF2971 domain-containing protein [Pseudomonas sp. B20]|uniref:DUF2971 domain-containing protein n=1 Tax=Pseudomonas sp. B20 TaxID=129268 RepID=UPI001CFAF870|nr:DUF2971 domain-containing protein [Pseudomonas sp. B20]
MPKYFYKYTSSAVAKKIIENGTLRWSTPGSLNDPYDIQFDFRTDHDVEKIRKIVMDNWWGLYTGELQGAEDNIVVALIGLVKQSMPNLSKDFFNQKFSGAVEQAVQVLNEKIDAFNKEVRGHMSTVKVLCLTECPVSQLMWAYYGDSNKGIALRFESDPEIDSPYVTAKPMRYQKHIPNLYDDEDLAGFISGVSSISDKYILEKLIYTKSDAWAHEKEWRLQSGDGRNKYDAFEDIKFAKSELTGVIFGCRMPEEERTLLANMVRLHYPHAEVLQAEIRSDEYQIEICMSSY